MTTAIDCVNKSTPFATLPGLKWQSRGSDRGTHARLDKRQQKPDTDRKTDMLLLLLLCYCIGGGGGGGPVTMATGHLYTDLTQPLARWGLPPSLAAPGALPTYLFIQEHW